MASQMTSVRARQTRHTLYRGVHHVRRPKTKRSVVERRKRDERDEDTLQDRVAEGSVQDRNKRRKQNLEQKKLLAGIGPCTTPPSVRLVGRPSGSWNAAATPGAAPTAH